MNCSRLFLLGLLFCGFFLSCLTVRAGGLTPDGPSGHDSLNILDSLVKDMRTSNSGQSIIYARKALAIARRSGSDHDLTRAYIMMGVGNMKDFKDSSLYYFNKAMAIADKANFKREKVVILYNLSFIYSAVLDLKTSIKLLDSTIRLAEKYKDHQLMAEAYNVLGNIKIDVNDTQDARKMYEESFRIAREHSLYIEMGVALGNLAKNQLQQDDKTSVKMQKEAITYLSRRKGNEEEIATILINIGYTQTIPDSALYYYKKALDLTKRKNLLDIEIGAYNNMAYSYLDKHDIVRAEACLVDHAIPMAVAENNVSWLSTLYDSYADILAARDDYKGALDWQKKSLQMRKKSETIQANGQVRLLAALLDVKNKELTIQIQQNRLQTTRFWLIFSLLGVVVTIFVSLSLQQRYRMKLQTQLIGSAKRLIEMEESEKGRTARELHDITGQLIMGITGAIENLDLPDEKSKHEIRVKIKDLGQSIRQISHRMNRAMLEHFTFRELIAGQCEDVQKLTGIPVLLEMAENFDDLQEETVLHTYRIIQELLTNASKYARDGSVSISLVSRNNSLMLSYQDNGPGFNMEEKKSGGMGLMNIFERSNLLGGKARVFSSPGEGTRWEITIPRAVKKQTT
jgi:signal transduction histidine kinase